MRRISDNDMKEAVRYLTMFARDTCPEGLKGQNAKRRAACLVRKLERRRQDGKR
jgi:hypothetical protein